MRAWICETHSEEDGPEAVERRTVKIRGSKSDVQALARFLVSVVEHLTADHSHVHLRDHMVGWTGSGHVDVGIDVT